MDEKPRKPAVADLLAGLIRLRRAIIEEMAIAESRLEIALKDYPASQSHVKALLARAMDGLEQKLAEAEREMLAK